MGEEHPDMAFAYYNLAKAKLDLGEPDARDYFDRALKLALKKYPDNHPKVQKFKNFGASQSPGADRARDCSLL
ncbi:MAG: tetratricopeptide repeat protein [Parachlamydia sp.]|nr:tetratricopeptide repeat protein [Parachlamydia sp.]